MCSIRDRPTDEHEGKQQGHVRLSGWCATDTVLLQSVCASVTQHIDDIGLMPELTIVQREPSSLQHEQ